MSQKLLLTTSIVFEGANFIDEIHQSVIDLESNIPKEEISNLIIKALSYIDKNLDNQTIDELISLIISCFLHYPDPSDEIINDIIENSRKNSNRIILTASILSALSKDSPFLKDRRVISFFRDSLKQILLHIRKQLPKFTIFDHEIQQQYKANFIIDMLLITKYNEESLKVFIPYIFSQKRISKTKFKKFIEKISSMKLITAIPESILLDREFFPLFTMDNLYEFIVKMSDETYFKLWPLIEENYSTVKKWSHFFVTAILYKSIKLKIQDFKLIENLLNSLDVSHMKNIVWKYLDQLNVILPISLADQIKKFPNPAAALKIMPNLDTIPVDVLSQGLLTSNDFDVYNRVFESNVLLNHPVENVFNQPEFWVHFSSVISSSEKKCSSEFLNFLATKFTNCNDKEKFNDIFNHMILDNYPITKNGNVFLISFFNKFNFEYKSVYFNNNLNLILEIMARNVLPLPIFWELISFYRIKNFFYENTTNPVLLYIYEFSLMRKFESADLINSITIEKVSNFDLINEFILKNDLDFLVKMNDESLTFIMHSFIFTRNKQKPKVKGLTKNIILPFFALGFNYVKYYKGNLLFSSEKISDLLIEACVFLSNNKSQILITSINTILSKFDDLVDPSIFPNKTAFAMINALYKLLISNSYPADKSLFLSVLFELSRRNKAIPEITELLENNSISLFNYIIDNMEKISDFSKLSNCPLNLDSFNCTRFIGEIFKVMQNKKEKIINTISFIEKYCKSVQKIKFSNVDKIIEVFQQSIKEKRNDDILLLGLFLKKNNFGKKIQQYVNEPIPYRIKEKLFDSIPFNIESINEIISDILSDSQPENDLTNCVFLFNELMKIKNIAIYYLTILFEKIVYEQEMKPNLFLKHFSNEYKLYKNLFIDAIRCVFGYHQIQNVFVRKISIKLPVINTLNPIITKLLNHQKYQSFFCLMNIASSFPFLLEKKPQLVFDSVIPSLDHFSLYFTIQKDCESDEIINKLKNSVSALFFLHSCLYSVQILDFFVPWFFKNIQKFSESQILSLTFILSSLFKTEKVQKLVLFLSMKYNLIEAINMLFDKDLKTKEISSLFRNNLYSILISYYDLLGNQKSNAELVYIDEIKNHKNPFSMFFNNKSTILPQRLKKLEIPPCKNNKIVDFMNKICEIKHFWLTSRLTNNTISTQDVDNFVNHYKSIESNLPDVSSIPKISRINSTNCDIVRLISIHPYWVFRWIANGPYFNLLHEHANKIQEVHNEINSFQSSDVLCEDIDLDDHFLPQYCQEKLFSRLMNDILSYEDHQHFLSVCKFIEILSDNKVALLSILDFLNRYLIDKKTQFNSSKPVNKMLNVLNNTIKSKYSFQSNFMQICGKNLIELVLSPDYRCDSQILLKSGIFFTLIDFKLPVQITHLIGFMLIHDSVDLTSLSLDLYDKIGEKIYLKNIVEECFERELKKKDPSYEIFDSLVRIPTIVESKIKKLPEFFESVVKKYSDGTNNDSGSQDLICILLNVLASEKIKDQFKFKPDEIDLSDYDSIDETPHASIQDPYSLKKAPKELIMKNPEFWNLYDRYLMTINEIISNNESKISMLKFVFNYPNLIGFKRRLKFFREKMDKRINKNSYFYINVDRSNILVNSFTKLNNKPTSEWLKELKVSFNGESGLDAGGLTREWFTYIIRDLFNTNNALFVSSESKSYQPNKSSYINQEHLEYFKFAGKLIARALIQGQCVNAHLTRSFIRQILGHQIKFIDLQDLDKELYKNLDDLREMDVEPLDLVFSIDANEYGVHKTINLKENGEEILVTNDNKIEYISLYADYHLRKAIINQITAFRDGFNSLIQQEDIRLFSPSELDLLICGIPEIDVEDMKENTKYNRPYSPNHPVIIMFFNVISRWDNENLAKFLLFLTGSSQVPVNGFKYYKDCDKPITISPGGSRDRLCVSHTCFNILDLPSYENEDEMNDKLIQSIQECEFGLG